jgi:hypothetical protein
MAKLISIPDIFTLINNTNITKPSDMVNKNLFSRMKIPSTELIVKNYICFDYNSRTFAGNKDLKQVTVNVIVICNPSDDNIITAWGNRHDVLGGVIIDAFNWSNFLGFELELTSDNERIFEGNYHARELQFKNLTPNSLSNGVKMDGY